MNTRQLILNQRPNTKEWTEAAEEIITISRGEPLFLALSAISYGIILGKQRERARRKKG